MKISHSLLIAFGLTSSVMLLPVAARAQAPTPASSATPSVSAPSGEAPDAHAGKRGEMKDRMASLTPEEREKFKAAHQKAMQDPAVKTAEAEKTTDRKAYRKAVHDAMLRADPSIEPILQKLHPEGHHGGPAAE